MDWWIFHCKQRSVSSKPVRPAVLLTCLIRVSGRCLGISLPHCCELGSAMSDTDREADENSLFTGEMPSGVIKLYVCTFGKGVTRKDTMWYQEEKPHLRPWRCPMPQPILGLDEELR